MPGRSEDRGLITGSAGFVEDLADADTLWAAFLRSPVAHGRIKDIDRSDVADSDAFVFIDGDLGLEPQPGKLRPSLPGHIDYRRPILADSVVRFEGEAIALVVASSPAQAEDAIEKIWVDFEEEPAVLTVDDAMADRTVLHPVVGTNQAVMADFSSGEAPAWGVGEPEVEIVVESPRVAPVPMEPLSILVSPKEGRLEIVCGSQTPHRLKLAVAESLGVEPEAVRVVVPEVGGAFGQKGAVYVEYLAVARAAQLLGRPVIWVQRRRDNLRSATHGRGARHRVRLGGREDGTLTQAEIEIVGDLGAYPQMGGVVPLTSAVMAPGPYRFDRFSVRAVGVLTNKNPTGPYRGAGRPEATYAIERAIDAFARRIGKSPEEVRQRSLLPAHDHGAESATGLRYDSGHYRAALDKAVAALDLEHLRAEQRRRIETGHRKVLGAAVICFVERAGGPVEFGEYATVALAADGRLELRVGTAPSGQGHRTSFERIVAEVFGVPRSAVEWGMLDTDVMPAGGGTYGSRSGQLGGSATRIAAEVLAERCREFAAELYEAAVEDILIDDGTVSVVGVPDMELSLAELAAAALERGVRLEGTAEFAATSQTFPYGAHGAVVEVDLDTGDVDVQRVVAVDDCGTVIDPMIVMGQVHGSLAQGLGQAMLEKVVHSDTGTLITSTLMDYTLPTATDVPNWEVHHLITPSPTNPLGVKGIGESGTIGLPAALVNAVLDALEPFGVAQIDMPLTPGRVWTALAEARQRST